VDIGDRIALTVPAHGVRVLLRDAPVDAYALRRRLDGAPAGAR